MEAKNWTDERLKVMVLQALALQAHGETVKAVNVLVEVLGLAEPAGFVRSFLDEGIPMTRLLSAAVTTGTMADYVGRLLSVVDAGHPKSEHISPRRSAEPQVGPPIEPLSTRELEVLRLISQGLSNRQIAQQLFLALDTVKGHNRKIFGKLQVQRRTEAVARARQLGLS
jgi:ATP/maltotriose-dependent transcriptional regulator MalT